MALLKVTGLRRIYQVESFSADVDALFGKNTGEKKRYLRWLFVWLSVLDREGMHALQYEQFEHLKNTRNPHLYAIRHPKSTLNERYIYMYADGECAVLLTAFKEKDARDYAGAIAKAQRLYAELEGERT